MAEEGLRKGTAAAYSNLCSSVKKIQTFTSAECTVDQFQWQSSDLWKNVVNKIGIFAKNHCKIKLFSLGVKKPNKTF